MAPYLKILWQLSVNLLSDGTGSGFSFVTRFPHRYHIVCVHFVHRNGQSVSRLQEQMIQYKAASCTKTSGHATQLVTSQDNMGAYITK